MVYFMSRSALVKKTQTIVDTKTMGFLGPYISLSRNTVSKSNALMHVDGKTKKLSSLNSLIS